jgi:hypothetical protein
MTSKKEAVVRWKKPDVGCRNRWNLRRFKGAVTARDKPGAKKCGGDCGAACGCGAAQLKDNDDS